MVFSFDIEFDSMWKREKMGFIDIYAINISQISNSTAIF